MKNILFLHAGAELYGADIILYNLVKNINKDEFNVFVVLPNDGPLVKKLRGIGVYCEVIDYPILRRKYFSITGLLYYCTNFFSKSNQIYKLLRDQRIDIIHNNTLAVLEGIYLKNKFNAKLIVHVHEIIKNPKLLSKFLSKIFAHFSDSIICVSRAVAHEVEEHVRVKYQQKIEVIYNGVDNNIFHPNYNIKNIKSELQIPNNSLVVGMIGRVNSWKGQLDFLSAIKKVLTKHNNTYAILVGGVFEGEEWRYLEIERKINELNLQFNNRIKIFDFREDNYLIHNLIDIFVLPSTNPDPLPTVVLESMACENPIVAYRHGGVCEMVEEGYNGLFADVCNPHDLSLKINILLEDDLLLEKFSNNSRIRQLDNFSISSFVNNFIACYSRY